MERQAQADLGVKPFINWIGGKEKLQRIICSTFPQNIRRYVEHFGGSGAILLGRRRKRGVMEVYNDYNSDLVKLFLCVKKRFVRLSEELKFFPLHSEEEFKLYRDILNHVIVEPDFTRSEIAAVDRNFTGAQRDELIEILQGRAELWDVRRAAAFNIMNRGCYSGNMDSFGVRSINFGDFVKTMEAASRRLTGVPILNRDCVASIRLNDKPGTLHYCDPPYYTTEDKYKVTFGKQDHRRLHDALRECVGYVVTSYNCCDYICDLYSDFYILKFARKNGMAKRKGAMFEEVVLTNYDPRPMIELNQSQMSMFGPPDLEQENAKLTLIHKPLEPTEWEKKNLK